MSDWRTEDVTDWRDRAEAAEAERDALKATVERVRRRRDGWSVRSALAGHAECDSSEWITLTAVVSALTDALDGDDE